MHPEEPRQILLQNQVWFSNVRSQDDIFEGRPLFAWTADLPSDHELTLMSRRQMPGANAADIQRVAQHIRSRIRDPIIREEVIRGVEREHTELYERSSILSFFKDATLQRYWAQYANNGRGYALAFDFSIPWRFESAPGMGVQDWAPFPVRYVFRTNRPTITLSLCRTTPQAAFSQLEQALLTKSEEWLEQQEERLIRLGIPAGHVSFPAPSLVALIVGYNTSDEDLAALRALVGQRATELPIFRVEPSNSYGLRLDVA